MCIIIAYSATKVKLNNHVKMIFSVSLLPENFSMFTYHARIVLPLINHQVFKAIIEP